MKPDGKFFWERLIELLGMNEGVNITPSLVPVNAEPDTEPAA